MGGAVSRALESSGISRSPQLKKLLAYLRDASLSGDETQVTETAIGTNVFLRRDFNPRVDTIVRSEMVRLRRKLEEFYNGEGASEPFRLAVDKNLYRLMLIPNAAPVPRPVTPDAAPATRPVTPDKEFWKGAAAGAGCASVLFAVAALVVGFRAQHDALPASIANHPLWSGFRSAEVDVLEGSPLFFKTSRGYERDLRLNFGEDVSHAKDVLTNWPAVPTWDKWAPLGDIGAVIGIDRFLRQFNSTAKVVPARERSIGSLAGRRTIILGHPRFAPLLAEVLASLDFRAPQADETRLFSGFVNAAPRPGELTHYSGLSTSQDADQRDAFLSHVDESTADYGLITSVRLEKGGEVLSLFGNHLESVSILLRQLTDPLFLDELNRKVFVHEGQRHRSAQIVVRIGYIHGQATGVEYLTSRVHY
jgi:hypothetical protein